MRYWTLAVLGLAVATPAGAQSVLEQDFDAALRGCEEWVLNPASWAEGFEPFESAVGLGNRMGRVDSAEEAQLPPAPWRVANHFWRINSTVDAGYMLVVSDRLPICHITGGGSSDLQPVIESVLDSEAFRNRWDKVDARERGGMTTTTYRNREEPAFSMAISRASQIGQRLDRVQVLASASMELPD